jgi:hypothetical protein
MSGRPKKKTRDLSRGIAIRADRDRCAGIVTTAESQNQDDCKRGRRTVGKLPGNQFAALAP